MRGLQLAAILALLLSFGVAQEVGRDIQAEEINRAFGRINSERTQLWASYEASKPFIEEFNKLEVATWAYCVKYRDGHVLDMKLRKVKNDQAAVAKAALDKISKKNCFFSQASLSNFEKLIELYRQL